MSDPKANGKTLWEMLTERLKDSGPISFFNPLDLRIGSAVAVSHGNGPEFEGYDFSVIEIRDYARKISGQEFHFADYVLKGINTKSFDMDQEATVRLRVVPARQNTKDAVLLRLYDEMAFAEDFLQVVNDDTGIFETSDDEKQEQATYTRINEVKGSYEAAVMIVTKTTADGKAEARSVKSIKLEYWDYWREMEIGGGQTAAEFVFVEMDAGTGWFQIWRGTEFFM